MKLPVHLSIAAWVTAIAAVATTVMVGFALSFMTSVSQAFFTSTEVEAAARGAMCGPVAAFVLDQHARGLTPTQITAAYDTATHADTPARSLLTERRCGTAAAIIAAARK